MKYLALVLVTSALVIGAGTPAAGDDLPNILIISIDTMRGDCLGLHSGLVDTPWMDSLVRDAVYFREARAQAPWTLPNFASIFTGLRPYRHGALSKQDKLRQSCRTLAEYLSELGYRTQAHVNADVLTQNWGMTQGFDEVTYMPPMWNGVFSAMGAEKAVQRSYDTFRGGQPWFMHVHFFDVHTPYVTPKGFNELYYDGDPLTGPELLAPILLEAEKRFEREGKYKRWNEPPYAPWLNRVRDLEFPKAQYRGGIVFVDSQIGLILAKLQHLGLYEDCLIVLLSDHGETMGEQGFYFSHQLPYDGVLHVPLAIKFPGNTYGGKVVKSWVQTMDLLPTIADIVDFELPETLDAQTLMPLVRGKRGYNRKLFLAEMGSDHTNYIKSICDGRWHALRFEHHGEVFWELYDLRKDPAETVDLSLEEPKRLRKLEAAIWEIIDSQAPIRSSTDREDTELTDEQRDRLRALGY